MTLGSRPCAWAQEGEHGPAQHRYCIGWNDACERKGCERKRGAAQRRKAELAEYRKFPGNDLQQARRARIAAAREAGADPTGLGLPSGHCQWCEGPILKHDGTGALNTRRGWHDGRNGEDDCLLDYNQHTRAENQLPLLVRRQNGCCAGCGKNMASWASHRTIDPDVARTWGPSWVRLFPVDIYIGPFQQISRVAPFQVDHVIPLAIVVLTIPKAEQWTYWGPLNLQGLCHDCHVQKTRLDVQNLKNIRVANGLL